MSILTTLTVWERSLVILRVFLAQDLLHAIPGHSLGISPFGPPSLLDMKGVLTSFERSKTCRSTVTAMICRNLGKSLIGFFESHSEMAARAQAYRMNFGNERNEYRAVIILPYP